MLNRRKQLVPFGPPPVHFLAAVSRVTGGAVFVKRDDLMNCYCGSGNKVRKFEYLLYDAEEKGATALLTSGAVQSNHCATAASIAAQAGLVCGLVLEERVPGSYEADAGGNNYLYGLLGARVWRAEEGGVPAAIERRKHEMAQEGLVPYVVPGGGSCPLGALGYVRALEEISQQVNVAEFDAVLCASGSGGTHAGLLVGALLLRIPVQVIGVSVRYPCAEQKALILDLARRTAALLRKEDAPALRAVREEDVVVWDEYIGDGYALPSEHMAFAVEFFARREGILLDPVYSGKAAAALLRDARLRGKRILFVHTGGAHSLFHFRPVHSRDGAQAE